MTAIETWVGALLRSIVHRNIEALHAAASRPTTDTAQSIPAGYTANATFWVALAALVWYLSERTALSPDDFGSTEGHDALHALVPIIFSGAWWLDPTTGAVFAWHDLRLKGPNRAAWEKLWEAMV